MIEPSPELAAALDELDQATERAVLVASLDELRRRRGLGYAITSPDAREVLVAYDGQVIGRAWTETPGILGDWRAQPEGCEPLPGLYRHAREAAAYLAHELGHADLRVQRPYRGVRHSRGG